MSLDNIQIPTVLVQNLYKKSLVDLETNQSEQMTKKEDKWSFLGENKKHIVLIINENDYAYLSEEQMKFLMDILSACKLSMVDVSLINFARNPTIDDEKLLQYFSPEKLIFFGVSLPELGFPLQIPMYKLQSYNQQTYLSVPKLQVLFEQKDQKLLFWNCLKSLFLQ